MATRRNELYLALTLLCFFGIIAIFVVDGYMGVYDTLRIKAGEREETIEPDFWRHQRGLRETWVNRGDKLFFTYEIANNRFSKYAANVEVSVWRGQEKLRGLTSSSLALNAFAKGKVEWVVDASDLVPSHIPPEQHYQFSLMIKRGEIERKIIVNVTPSPYVPKPPRPG